MSSPTPVQACARPTADGGVQHAGPTRRARLVTAALAGLACLVLALAAAGLYGSPRGAGDNGDGIRLYCGAGLVPGTPDAQSNWKGGVVLHFSRAQACPDPIPSSALTLLRVSAAHSPTGYSLARLGWLYALLAALVTAVAAWCASAKGHWRALVLAPVVLPLADPDYTRFFVSTFSEPAGLLGAFTFICGVAALVVTDRQHRSARATALMLVAAGGLIAVTAKTAYAPLLLSAVLVCAATATAGRRKPRWTARVAGPALAVLIAVAAIAPLGAASSWQTRHYPRVNTYNLIYTTILTELPGSAAALGLPGSAGRYAGQAFFPKGPDGVPGADTIAARPDALRNAGWRLLAEHPFALARAVGVGMQATEGRDVSYLPSEPLAGQPPPILGSAGGEQEGADAPTLRAWLDGMRAPWWPSLVAAIGIIAGLIGMAQRSAGRLSVAFARTAGVGATTAVMLVVVAVLGDGYFEIAKHVWLAAYLLDVTLLALGGAVLVEMAASARRFLSRGAVQAFSPRRGTGRNANTATAAAPASDTAAKELLADGAVPTKTRTASAAIQPRPDRR